VVASYPDRTSKDVTEEVQFASANSRVATVDKAGLVTAHSNGGSVIQATYGACAFRLPPLCRELRRRFPSVSRETFYRY